MSAKEYAKLTVNLLKEELKRRSLDQSGKKADLVARLEKDDVMRASQEDDQVLGINDDTNNTEDFSSESKDLSEVENSNPNNNDNDTPGFNNSLNNSASHDDFPNNNNMNVYGSVEQGVNNNNSTAEVLIPQQQQQLPSATNSITDNDTQQQTIHNSPHPSTTPSTTPLKQQVGGDDNDAEQKTATKSGISASDKQHPNSTTNESSVQPDALNNINNNKLDDPDTATNNNASATTTTIKMETSAHTTISSSSSQNDNEAAVKANNGATEVKMEVAADTTATTITTATATLPPHHLDAVKTEPSSATAAAASATEATTTTTADSKPPTTSDDAIHSTSATDVDMKMETTEMETSTTTTTTATENTSPATTSTDSTTTTTTSTDSTTITTTPATDSTTPTSTTATTTTSTAATEVVDEARRSEEDAKISSLFCIEMKRDFDAFQLKWHGKKFTVPFLGEILIDLAEELSQRSFMASGLKREELKEGAVLEMIDTCLNFSIDFSSDVLGTSATGTLKMTFATKDECEERMTQMKEGIVISKVKFEEQVSQQFIHKDLVSLKDTIVDRLLYVGNLPIEVEDAAELKALFPHCTRLILPSHKEHCTASYAYVEYGSSDAVLQALEEDCKELVFQGCKLFTIKALCVRKERYGLLTDTLREILLEKVRKMKRIQKNPWNKSRQELHEIDKAISLNMEKLATDSKHRRGWGMQLGVLDEERIKTEDFNSGPHRGGGRGGSRGGNNSSNNRNVYDNRRAPASAQRYYGGSGGGYNSSNTYAGGSSGGGYGGSRSGWASNNQQTPSYYASTGGYQTYNQGYSNYPGYSGGQQQQQGGGGGSSSNYYSGSKRKASDSYGTEWKRPRN